MANNNGLWYYNFYAGPNAFPSPNAHFPRGPFNEEQRFDLTEEDLNQGSSSQSPVREPRHIISHESSFPEHELCKAMTLKVLSQSNKRDFTIYTLRDVTREEMQTPDSVKAIFAQVGDAVCKQSS